MTKVEQAKIAKKSGRWRRFFARAALILMLALIIFYLTAPRAVGWIIGYKLKSELSVRMNAPLSYDRLLYEFPYGVRIEHAHLLLRGSDGAADSWVNVGRLELTLAKLPMGAGPLVIQKLDIQNPLVHLAAKPASPLPPAQAAAPSQPAGASQKLSDLFQLRSITISAGQFEYDVSTPGKPVPPIAWGHLNAKMNTQPSSGGLYRFDVTVNDDPIASASASGAFDIDALRLDLSQFNLAITSDPSQRPQRVPPQVLDVIQQYHVAGTLQLSGSATLPIAELDKTTYRAKLSLKNAHLQPPDFAGPVLPGEFELDSSNEKGPCSFTLSVKDQHLTNLSANGSVDLSTMVLDLNKLDLSIRCEGEQSTNQLPDRIARFLTNAKTRGEFVLTGCAQVPLKSPQLTQYAAQVELKDGQCQLPGWNGLLQPAKLAFITSNIPAATATTLPTTLPIETAASPTEAHLWLRELSAACGNQLFKLNGGEISFNPATGNWAVRKMLGTVDLGDGPGPLAGDNVRFILPFVAAGEGQPGDSKSSVRFALDDGSAVVTPNHIHVNRISGLLVATADGLSSPDLTGNCAGGKIKGAFILDWNPPPTKPKIGLTYRGGFSISQMELHALAKEYSTDPKLLERAYGELDWHQSFEGSVLAGGPSSGADSPLDRLTGRGDLDITNGYFIDIPLLKDIVAAMDMANASTVGEAAARFDIAHGVVNFRRIGASSPALGIQGSGTLGFDQKVKMDFVATPLADWGKDLKGAGIVSKTAAAVVGKAEDVVNGLQGQLYSFRVVGMISKPKVETVPVPVVTDAIGSLFSKMAGNKKQGVVAEELKKQQEK